MRDRFGNAIIGDENRMVTIGVRVPLWLRELIHRDCIKNDTTVSRMIRVKIKSHLLEVGNCYETKEDELQEEQEELQPECGSSQEESSEDHERRLQDLTVENQIKVLRRRRFE